MRPSQWPRRASALAILMLSVLLHLQLLRWGNRQLQEPAPAISLPSEIKVELLPPPPLSPPPRPKPPTPAPQARAKATPRALPPPSPAPAIEGSDNATGTANGANNGAEAAPAPTAPDATVDAQQPASPPPSAELFYDVQALREGQTYYSGAAIRWNTDGKRYSIQGQASILFFTLLNFSSEGVVNTAGLAPELYSEKRRGKPPTETVFRRDRNVISFSGADPEHPLTGGEQDRASILWQLASLGHGDSSRFAPGAQFDFFVAGVRDGDVWHIETLGEETMRLDGADLTVWHLVRLPGGTYDKRIDIWLAPQRQWYPVKIRYTETNGDYVDMALSRIQS
ncbi:DUF3108 domain-containing protein [Herbaspirillum sp. RTI4]|uniref:DUF3108 domain-containing protein n=1 Tax=Herbaspirillum sp. RTI4 TaxID=3048640 RepID=UPI002AB4B594|nr:DUF3108 domain-containing protein [Herbaspirillum sp. RTI4]MDY7577677.1 DUF3108 domain-containing protein [Herbaspirillum sp. RTI4]MEA9983530.1 DUF3108 domain-containing protein [Herbaspirillum sp. RTI4]